MIVQSLTLSVTAGASTALLCLTVGGETDTAIRLAGFVAGLALLFGAFLDASLLYHGARSKAERLYWRSGPIVDVPAPPVAGNWPLQPFQSSPPVENIRLIPLRHNSTTFASTAPPVTRRLIENVDAADLAAFIAGLPERGLARRRWLGVSMPSGRKVDSETHQKLVAPLVKIGAIVDRSERSSGVLVMSVVEIKTRLGLA